ncbi:DAK2 domain-containing protein [Paenibacillus alginolyticus]|uniref:DAK2 domain-containing protein n=1 Tax=Paenibacillus alginolyticus TaxID=59839 RepID=A0ABT4GJH0_9BACL|nr:DAK2 domain-containing protein [Paenibacillus alginolyticus]MCY9668294.1 DAK2 domain-containing protein [Paenibacillus alginolyticus]MCY9696325.1 DAK2 domain-containing protein [Paenibacillus alginolyticus]MEC0142600.1 DAK2 domain-containing protein [Paenibacillus alginolyticus]
MSKRFISINGNDFTAMVLAGADNLRRNVDKVNGLNVFPVPDGDTGTNMNLTLTAGCEELKKKPSSHIGKAADALSKGLLMGARGNSGVILSQLFRGFAKHVHDLEHVNVQQFAGALQQGVETAYKAVVKPVEGTILTVSKEAAKHATQYRRGSDLLDLMQEVLSKAKEALARTPEQLAVLKQVGVVDAGGQGLVCVYEGFVTALSGGLVQVNDDYATMDTTLGAVSLVPGMNLAKEVHAHLPAQAHLATEDIEFGYCTEFMLTVAPGKVKGLVFDEGTFRDQLSKLGDSLLVVADDELVKVHIHAEYPGEVMNQAMNYGALSRIKIENMRDQHSHILEDMAEGYEAPVSTTATAVTPSKPYGFVAVALGEGITDILSSVGVDVVLSGGQTMNPSTEDIVNAVNSIDADTIYVLPNNSNIILAAQQASELVDNKTLIVIPSKSIPQGLAAILAFQEKADAQTNTAAMSESLRRVKSGQVTYAVRDTNMNGIDIKQGHFIGIQDGRIVSSQPSLLDACKKLLEEMIEESSEIVTILTGEDAVEAETEELESFIQAAYPDIEIELHPGGQPLYAYLFSVE